MPYPCHSALYLADVAGSLFISALICGTMLPLAIYSAKILLQVCAFCSVIIFMFVTLCTVIYICTCVTTESAHQTILFAC